MRRKTRFGLLAVVGITGWMLVGCTASSAPEFATGFVAPAEPAGSPAADPVGFGADEELWIIARDTTSPDAPPARVTDDETPGSGALVARIGDGKTEVPVPLRHTEVKARVSAYVAAVDVVQRFHNPFSEKIEAVYVFPLPQNAAVNEFVMTVGERRIRGIIRERAEAERIYLAARGAGKVASLMTQERPNIFTQFVANIEPGKEIDISVRYFNTLRWVDGGYEFVFPMVVGPRFNPPHKRDGIGAVARHARRTSGQSTEISYLRPTERSGHDIALSVDVDAGVKIEKLHSPTHVVSTKRPSPERALVALSPHDTIPNRDFVLRFKVAGDAVKSSVLTHRDARGGFFSLMLFPPEDLSRLERQPMELVFVLDCSGSMSDGPLAKAKQAVERALKRLNEEDSFQIVRFSSDASQLGPRPLVATPRNVRRGLEYLESLESDGGTMMIRGVRAALDFPADPDRRRVISFMTDGYIGNEREIFAEIHRKIGDARIFSFGVGSSVNRHLLEGMARLGRGAVAYVGLDESSARAVDLFFQRVSHPALTDIAIDWGAMGATEIYPRRVPDLFAGRPVVLTGRFTGDGPARIRISGDSGSSELSRKIAVDLAAGSAPSHPGIPSVWARQRIAVLSDRAAVAPESERDELAHAIRQVALEFGLLSSFTAFVAVDSLSQTEGTHGTTVPVAVPVPAGVRYDTTVGK